MIDFDSGSDKIYERIKKLNDFILESKREAQEGQLVDISGLDTEARAICDEIQNLPQYDVSEFEEPLNEMVSNLDGLMNSLNDLQQEIQKKASEEKGAKEIRIDQSDMPEN